MKYKKWFCIKKIENIPSKSLYLVGMKGLKKHSNICCPCMICMCMRTWYMGGTRYWIDFQSPPISIEGFIVLLTMCSLNHCSYRERRRDQALGCLSNRPDRYAVGSQVLIPAPGNCRGKDKKWGDSTRVKKSLFRTLFPAISGGSSEEVFLYGKEFFL